LPKSIGLADFSFACQCDFTFCVIAGQSISEEELEDKLEKGDFSVFTQRASIWILVTFVMID